MAGTGLDTFVTELPGAIDWPTVASFDTFDSVFSLTESALMIPSTDKYLWVVIVGGLVCFFMAWGIGANDVANAFATSVGAGSINLLWACIIGGVMEFAGAVLLGKQVTDTVRKKIIDQDLFDPNKGGALNGPEVLMTGFLAALVASSTWLFVATALGLPVSTTHSIIGSLIGVGLTYGGGGAVVWISDGEGIDKLAGVVGVIVSWFISPILSGIIAVILFLIVRHTVLRRKNSVRNGFIFTPFLYGFAVVIVIFFILYKGAARFDVEDSLSVGAVCGISFGAGAGVAIFTWFIINPLLHKMLNKWEADYLEKLKNPKKEQKKVSNALKKVGVHVEVSEELSDEVLAMHDNSEKFDPKTEQLFTWVQVFTAAFDAFSHGANDVANSVGPFASIYSLYINKGIMTVPNTDKAVCSNLDFTGSGATADQQEFTYYLCADEPFFGYKNVVPSGAVGPISGTVEDSDGNEVASSCYSACAPGSVAAYSNSKQPVPVWILVMGGAGIVVGLATWGYRIIVAIGTKLTKLTPSRGTCIELGASITVLIASQLGLPVSTTHCQVGATVGVGVVELKGNTVNWRQFIAIFAGWVFTLVFTGFIAAGIFAYSAYSPQKIEQPQIVNYCPGNQMFVMSEVGSNEADFSGIVCSGLTPTQFSVDNEID
mmetsp:Transcript_22623/g.90676  ORF Transcript_22623/g.90676 Transcript_22623/m.90676 type:complete len:657 (-) Transcript_22623:121-2091(-)|eukprot:CAMPEP_0113955392 /NCGR_PEP_ID=MMETSP0011_2-20120614/1297_1 /TAXON_ID=101924 /ORGANISM="Rhodosorus marinus" /LENGTH=656 /DNA_ID=CAMNT_0000965055 /DNA_START=137 /DNA_END=2107 /DNA_ORIENTATION=+ /assembly_acc=CAM_ASM_000156